MSLTSYRAGPPRGRQGSEDRYQESEGVGIRDVSFWLLILARPGGDRLSRALGRSTIGAEGFHGRVRDGIGCWPLAIATRPCGDQRTDDSGQMTEVNEPGRSTETFLSSVYCPLVFWTDDSGQMTEVNE